MRNRVTLAVLAMIIAVGWIGALRATSQGRSIASESFNYPNRDAGRPGARDRDVPVETRSLDELYRDALEEGGGLVVYAGGDMSTQFDAVEQAFERQFPGVDVKCAIDLSKFHNGRIENQLLRNRLEPDVAMLQTLANFDNWEREGRLLHYKPLGWNQVYPFFKEPHGAYTATATVAFTNVVSTRLSPDQAPRDYADYLDPKYKDQISLTYPNDDDAILFQFKLIVDKYGWEYLDKLMAQAPVFVRGTPQSADPIRSGQKLATFTSLQFLGIDPYLVGARLLFPKTDPFVSWGQRSAIFKDARHPAAAKLFMSWMLSIPRQQSQLLWSVRRDVPPPFGLEPLSKYNTDPNAFLKFMSDRAGVELFKTQIELYVGPVQGPSPITISGPGPFFAEP